MDDETIKYIRDALHKYPKKNVDRFLVDLMITCNIKDRLASAKDISTHRKMITKMRKNLETTLADLKLIMSKEFNILPQKTFEETEGQKVASYTDAAFFSANAAANAYDPLRELLDIIQSAEKTLESQKPRRGREQADSQGLYTEIRVLFEKHLGKPSSYEFGPFAEVMAAVTGQIDTRRGVKQAVKPT